MDPVVDLGSELLVDESAIRDPYLRLMLAAIGERVLTTSPWVALDKRVVALWLAPCPVPDSPTWSATAELAWQAALSHSL